MHASIGGHQTKCRTRTARSARVGKVQHVGVDRDRSRAEIDIETPHGSLRTIGGAQIVHLHSVGKGGEVDPLNIHCAIGFAIQR